MLPLSAAAAKRWAGLRREFGIGARDGLGADLIRSTSRSFALRAVSMVLSLITGIVLARALGASQYGVYAYAMAFLELLKVPAALGLPTLVMREVAVYSTRQDWGRFRGLLVRANQIVLGTSLLLMLLAAGTSWALAGWFASPEALRTFWLALLLLPLAGLTDLRSACLTGLQRVVLGQVPENLVRPAIFLSLLGSWWLIQGAGLTAELAMGLQVVAVSAAFLVGAVWLLQSLPREVQTAAPDYELRAWLRSASSYLFMSGLFLINANTDIVMLGWFGTATDVGVYRVVATSSFVLLFPFEAAYRVLAPTVARLHAEADGARLQRLITQATRGLLLISLPGVVLFVLGGRWILSLVFGSAFGVGAGALAIIAVGQLIHKGVALAEPVLCMTGYERDAAKAAMLAAFANIALNAPLIPLFGIEGAALASAVSLVLCHLWLAVQVHRRLGLDASPLGRP